jgi:hypothetical protein
MFRCNLNARKFLMLFILNILLTLQIFILVIYNTVDPEINFYININSCIFLSLFYLNALYSIKYPNFQNKTLEVAFVMSAILLWISSIVGFGVNISNSEFPPKNLLQLVTAFWFFTLCPSYLVWCIYLKFFYENNNQIDQIDGQVITQEEYKNDNTVIISIENITDNCSICLLTMENTNTVKTICKHIFHKHCIMKNINEYKNKNCPLCRTEIIKI